VQGFYVARPMAESEFLNWLSANADAQGARITGLTLSGR
jgi:hypothetical protein